MGILAAIRRPKVQENTILWRQAIDRIDVVMLNMYNNIEEHPVIYQNPVYKEKIKQAQDLLLSVFQDLNTQHFPRGL
jgi:hypothetical protein